MTLALICILGRTTCGFDSVVDLHIHSFVDMQEEKGGTEELEDKIASSYHYLPKTKSALTFLQGFVFLSFFFF